MPGSGTFVAGELSSKFPLLQQGNSTPPRQLIQLAKVIDWLDNLEATARVRGNRAAVVRAKRDRSFVLLGFWCGLRSQELIQLRVEHTSIAPGAGMTCFLASREARGLDEAVRWLPSLTPWCPIASTLAWKNAARLTQGPLYRAVNYRSVVSEAAWGPSNVFRSLRRILTRAGLRAPNDFTGRSLRRGFSGWAESDGWDVKALMEYVRVGNEHLTMLSDADDHRDRRNRLESIPSASASPFPKQFRTRQRVHQRAC